MEGLNLEIPHGKFIALIGANGVGKSTLIRTLANLQKALHGKVFLKEKMIRNRIHISITDYNNIIRIRK